VDDLATTVIEGLLERGMTLVLAESCTGGLAAARLTTVPGASRVFLGSFVVYREEMKKRLLGITDDLVRRAGTVSDEITRALAVAARERSGADIAVAVTCSAGPGVEGDSEVGESYVSVSSRDGVESRRFHLTGDRSQNREELVDSLLRMVVDLFGLTVR
jgi:PncC family amidohydrolase